MCAKRVCWFCIAGAPSWAAEPQAAQAGSDADDDAGHAGGVPATEQGSAAEQILQQLCDGQIPWEDLSGVDTLPLVRKRMGLTALKIRAAATEQDLVVFEFTNLFRSYDDRLRELSEVLQAKQRQHAECINTLETIQGVSGERQQALSVAELAQVAAVSEQRRLLYGQCVLLQRKHAHLQRLQRRAQQLHADLQSFLVVQGDQPPQLPQRVMQAAAAAAEVDMGGDDAADGQQDIGSEEEEEWVGDAEHEGQASVFEQQGGVNAAAQSNQTTATAGVTRLAASGAQPVNTSPMDGTYGEVGLQFCKCYDFGLVQCPTHATHPCLST